MADRLDAIKEAADALTEPVTHIEPVYERDRHRNKRLRRVRTVSLPSLLDQLAELAEPSRSADGDGRRTVPSSRPPVDLDAVSAHAWIGAGAARWTWSLRLAQRDTVASNIRGLVGAASTLDSDTQAALLTELRQWRHLAQVLTGWVTPPWQPNVPCPVVECGRRRLRVRWDTRSAVCLHCGATWDTDTIGVLAEYITKQWRCRQTYTQHVDSST